MSPSDPQFMYMVLVLPSMFGLTMVGEGVNKILKQQGSGWVSMIMGVVFMMVVGVAYLYLAGFL